MQMSNPGLKKTQNQSPKKTQYLHVTQSSFIYLAYCHGYFGKGWVGCQNVPSGESSNSL